MCVHHQLWRTDRQAGVQGVNYELCDLADVSCDSAMPSVSFFRSLRHISPDRITAELTGEFFVQQTFNGPCRCHLFTTVRLSSIMLSLFTLSIVCTWNKVYDVMDQCSILVKLQYVQ